MNYGELKTNIAAWSNRTDLGSIIPTFVQLAEARIGRDVRSGLLVKSATVAIATGQSSAAMPSDYAEGQGLFDQSGYNYAPPGKFAELVAIGEAAGVYSIFGGSLVLGNASVSGASFTLLYYSKPAALVNDTDDNALLLAHPGLYLFGALAELMIFLADDTRAVLFEAKYRKEVEDAKTASYSANFFGTEQRAGGSTP